MTRFMNGYGANLPRQTGAAMDDRADVTQTVLDLYESFGAGDIDATLARFHPDVVMRISGDPAVVPFAGIYRGRDGVRRFIGLLSAELRWEDFRLDDLMIDGSKAVVRWHAPMTIRRTGKRFVFHLVDHIQVREGTIVALDEWFDTAAAAEVLGRVGGPALDSPFVEAVDPSG